MIRALTKRAGNGSSTGGLNTQRSKCISCKTGVLPHAVLGTPHHRGGEKCNGVQGGPVLQSLQLYYNHEQTHKSDRTAVGDAAAEK